MTANGENDEGGMVVAGREPSPMDASRAFEEEQAIKRCLDEMRAAWVELAERLYRFANGKMYRDLGYGTFDEWLASPEIDLSRRHVFALIEVWREYVVERGVAPERLNGLRVTKAREVLAAVRRGEVDVESALADARTLSRGDIRERYGRGGGNDPLDAEREPEWTVCPTCGSKVRG